MFSVQKLHSLYANPLCAVDRQIIAGQGLLLLRGTTAKLLSSIIAHLKMAACVGAGRLTAALTWVVGGWRYLVIY